MKIRGFIFGITLFMIISCEVNNKQNIDDDDKDVVYLDTAFIVEEGDTVGFYELISSKKNGKYKYFLNKKISQECLFYNDTILGFFSFYDSSGALEMKKSYNYFDNQMSLNEKISFLKNGNIDTENSFFIQLNNFSPIVKYKEHEKIKLNVSIHYFDFDSIFISTPLVDLKETKKVFPIEIDTEGFNGDSLIVLKFRLISYVDSSKVIYPLEKRLLFKSRNR